MNILRQLLDKSWETPGLGLPIADHAGGLDQAAKTALGFLLAVLTSMFALFIIGYRMRMMMPDWQSVADPRLLWLNTIVLIASSICMQRAKGAAAVGHIVPLRNNLTLGWLLTIAFLLGQYLVWTQLRTSGLFAANSPAVAFMYLLVGLHALHLCAGLVFCSKAIYGAWQKIEVSRIRLLIDMCTTYWHYLLLVWLVFFALLLST